MWACPSGGGQPGADVQGSAWQASRSATFSDAAAPGWNKDWGESPGVDRVSALDTLCDSGQVTHLLQASVSPAVGSPASGSRERPVSKSAGGLDQALWNRSLQLRLDFELPMSWSLPEGPD